MNTEIQEILAGYLPCFKGEAEVVTGSGSNRLYLRLTDETGRRTVAVKGSCVEENRAFVQMARHFAAKGLPVPALVGELSADGHFYLQEDVGRRSLFDALAEGRKRGGIYNKEEEALLHRTVALLPRFQFEGAEGFDFASWCHPKAEFDRQGVMFDLNYFKYCFLKAVVDNPDEVALEADFNRMADLLLDEADGYPWGFLYRDFQARNVMLREADGSPCFIDFQGGRRGPLFYDLASFLWQAAARYPEDLRERLIDTYLTAARPCLGEVDRADFRRRLSLFVLFRLMQVLGAYGFRGYFERKAHFLTSIPPAIGNVRALLSDCPEVWTDFPCLCSLMEQVCALPRFAPQTKREELEVRVSSFSFKKGIPEDPTGNGGGYVFDCRGMNNPGRYAEYKPLTGLDEPVIRFLEEQGEVQPFLENIYRLADAHVADYLRRGFTDLMFSFGCTGGQHRSVYCAQHLAEYLHRKHGIRVVLWHREQGIMRELKNE